MRKTYKTWKRYNCWYSVILSNKDGFISSTWEMQVVDLHFKGETAQSRYSYNAFAEAFSEMRERIKSVNGRFTEDEEKTNGLFSLRNNIYRKARDFDQRQIEIRL